MCKCSIGLISGMIIGLVVGCNMKNQHKMKRKANKAMYAMGDLFSNVPCMFKS